MAVSPQINSILAAVAILQERVDKITAGMNSPDVALEDSIALSQIYNKIVAANGDLDQVVVTMPTQISAAVAEKISGNLSVSAAAPPVTVPPI